MLWRMEKPKRIQSYLVQLRIDKTPGLCGRLHTLGTTEVVTFTNARELVEALRRLKYIPQDEEGKGES